MPEMIDIYHQRKTRKCKYCSDDAKRNILPNGRNKGFYLTCGSDICLKKQYTDPEICNKKRYEGKAICLNCHTIYEAESSRQKWCKKCVPNKKFRRIMQRYGISKKEYDNWMEKTHGICEICHIRKATMIDHDHKTGKVRGMLCSHCNTALPIVEDSIVLSRALVYIGGHYTIH